MQDCYDTISAVNSEVLAVAITKCHNTAWVQTTDIYSGGWMCDAVMPVEVVSSEQHCADISLHLHVVEARAPWCFLNRAMVSIQALCFGLLIFWRAHPNVIAWGSNFRLRLGWGTDVQFRHCSIIQRKLKEGIPELKQGGWEDRKEWVLTPKTLAFDLRALLGAGLLGETMYIFKSSKVDSAHFWHGSWDRWHCYLLCRCLIQ